MNDALLPPAEPGAFEKIRQVILAIPFGKVASYGQVARKAGFVRGARTVVWVLKASVASLPWHRVLRQDGTLAIADPSGRELQHHLLAAEGVGFTPDQKVTPEYFFWGFISKGRAGST
ncbi:MAG: DNA methyltransferase [Spirochaetales bacterium]|nr:DNA methyltransferase [Spirochaetales bacterium]